MFTKAGPKVALLGPAQNREPPMKGGVHLRTAAVVEPAAGKRATSAGWLVSASDVGAEGSETPRLQAAGKVPTVAAQGSRAPRGAATPSTQSNPPTRPPYDMGSPGIRRPMPGEGQKGDTHGGERYRPEKPTRRAQSIYAAIYLSSGKTGKGAKEKRALARRAGNGAVATEDDEL